MIVVVLCDFPRQGGSSLYDCPFPGPIFSYANEHRSCLPGHDFHNFPRRHLAEPLANIQYLHKFCSDVRPTHLESDHIGGGSYAFPFPRYQDPTAVFR